MQMQKKILKIFFIVIIVGFIFYILDMFRFAQGVEQDIKDGKAYYTNDHYKTFTEIIE